MKENEVKLRLEINAVTVDYMIEAMHTVIEKLQEGETSGDFTAFDYGRDLERYAYSYKVKTGIEPYVLNSAKHYYDSATRDEIREKMHESIENCTKDGKHIPVHLHSGLVDYVMLGEIPGHFLTACIENNLGEALGQADSQSLEALSAVYAWLYNHAPSYCHGSYENMERWAEAHAVAAASK